MRLAGLLHAPLLHALELVPTPVAAVDARRVMVYANPAFCREFSVTPAGFVGQDAFSWTPDSERSRLLDEWRDWQRGASRIVRMLLPNAAKPGLRLYFVLPVPFVDGEGRYLGVVLTYVSAREFPVRPEPEAGRRALSAVAREIRAGAAAREAGTAAVRRVSLPGIALTAREASIARLLARGDRVSNIALALRIRPITVRNHLKSVFRKAGVHSQRELLAKLRDSE